MSKRLKVNYKKAVCSVLIAAGSLGAISPMTYLNAATVNNAASTTKASSQSVKIKDTTITFNDVTAAPKGNIGFLINATLEKESGIPEGTTHIYLSGGGKLTVNGKDYELSFGGGDNFKKLSNTKAELQISIIPTIGEGANRELTKDITAENIKGKTSNITFTGITYYHKDTTISKQFQEQLKKVTNVQGVSLEKAGLGDLKGYVNGPVLPAKGLNIPVQDEGKFVIDNIGFVDGKLQIRTDGDLGEVDFIDSTGKKIKRDNQGGIDYVFIARYDIKDLAALAKCVPQVSTDKQLAEDEEQKTITYTF